MRKSIGSIALVWRTYENPHSFFFSLLAGIPGQAASHEHHEHKDHPSVHGMAVLGKKTIYLSHLPMFHSPHDYQVILEAELDEDTMDRYLKSREESSETVYTISPETFVLPEMVMNPEPFRAQLFRGHFERGGTLLAQNTEVKIKRVIYFQKFHPGQEKSKEAIFLLFGKEETFLAHEISAKPDFDQLLSVDLGPIPDGVTKLVLQAKGNKPVQSPGLLRFKTVDGAKEWSGLVKSLYLEEGELAE